jgi:hypothetical protein
MKLTDTLDQILRLLLVTDGSSGEGRSRAALTNGQRGPDAPADRPTIAAELEARAAARAASPEPAAPAAPEPPAVPAPTGPELARLEAAAGVVEKLGLGFHLGAAVERIAVAAGEGSTGERKLYEATWLIDRYLELLERRPISTDQVTMMRLAREGDAIAGLQAIASALGEPPAPPAPEPPRFSTALPAAVEPPAVEQENEQGRQPDPAPAPVLQPQPTFRRELALTSARALIVVVAVVLLVLVLTLISQWR